MHAVDPPQRPVLPAPQHAAPQQPFHGFTFDGARYDCGDKAGYIQANLALALARPDIGPAVRSFAQMLLG